MNEFMRELSPMKTQEFWHKFLQNQNVSSFDDKKEMSTAMSSQLSPSHPLYNSSAFFDANNHPTISDQVTLCREIAKQLVCDESNAKSKGREMFERRVQKSSKWVTASGGLQTTDDDNTSFVESCDQYHERTISEGPPNLRLVLDPRHVQDINSLGFESNEQIMNVKTTRDMSSNIIRDLTSPEVHPNNKGNQLFAKRAEQSSEWIVESVVEKARDKQLLDLMSEPVVSCGQEMQMRAHKTCLQMNEILFYPKFRDFNCKPKPFIKY